MSPYSVDDPRLPNHVATKIDPPDEGGCWLWNAALTGAGYGETWDPVAKKVLLAHRYVYELLVGPIPDGLELDHLCKVTVCVNPEHLEPVTHAENIDRGDWWMVWTAQRLIAMVQTHCPAGHAYAEFGRIYRSSDRASGERRICRECRNIEQRALRAKARAQ